MINSRVGDFKKEIINGSKMKLSQIILSQSQMNIKNDNELKEIHSLETHPGISCCKCGMNPIIGNRYCCIQCDNVNFCDKCEEEIGFDHGHPLYKFKLRIELLKSKKNELIKIREEIEKVMQNQKKEKEKKEKKEEEKKKKKKQKEEKEKKEKKEKDLREKNRRKNEVNKIKKFKIY